MRGQNLLRRTIRPKNRQHVEAGQKNRYRGNQVALFEYRGKESAQPNTPDRQPKLG